MFQKPELYNIAPKYMKGNKEINKIFICLHKLKELFKKSNV